MAKNESSMRHSRCDGDELSHYPTSRRQKHKSLSATSTLRDRTKADVIQKSHSHTSNNCNLLINCLSSRAFSVPFLFLLRLSFSLVKFFTFSSQALPHVLLRHTSDPETQRGGRAVPRGCSLGASQTYHTRRPPPLPPAYAPALTKIPGDSIRGGPGDAHMLAEENEVGVKVAASRTAAEHTAID